MFLCSIAPKASDLASITSHIHNWVLFLLWLHLFTLSGVISPLISSSILATYQPGEFIFQCPFCLFILFMGFSRQEYWSGPCFSSFVRPLHDLPSWVALHGMAHSFTELDKAVVHVIRLVSFLWLWFIILSALWCRRIRGLWKLPDGRDWLRGKLDLVLMGGAMLHISLIQFSVDGCVPSLLFDLRPNYAGGNEDNGNLLQNVPCMHCHTQPPNPAAGHCWPMPLLLETPGHPWASLGQSLVGSLLLSPGSWCTWGFVCALQQSVSQSCVSSGSSMFG